jgi:general secretion pathway protein D
VLANPRIRVKNKDKARIHIGDKVPVITTTASATGFVGESVNYLDVGLKLEVEPTVYLEDEVGIKIGLEVSNISQQIRSSSGTVAYQVGTRNTATTLRLKDGETQVLAGLINDEDRRSSARVPGLGDTPVLEHLFGSTGTTANKTEIVLLITPRIVRNLTRPDVRLESFNSGTDGAIGQAPLILPSIGAGNPAGGGSVVSQQQGGSTPAAPSPSDGGNPPPPPPGPAPGASGAPGAPGAPAPAAPPPPVPGPASPGSATAAPAAMPPGFSGNTAPGQPSPPLPGPQNPLQPQNAPAQTPPAGNRR